MRKWVIVAFIFITGPGAVDAWLSLFERFFGDDRQVTVTFGDWYSSVFPIIGLAILLGGLWWTRPHAIKGVELSEPQEGSSPTKPFAVPDELMATHLKGLTFRLVDLAREDIHVRKKVIEDCHIHGPAMMTSLGQTAFFNPTLHGDEEQVLIEVNNTSITGAIGLEDCVIRNCHFYRIAFIGPHKFIEKVRASMVRK